MKQHITTSELRQLSPMAREKLRDWWIEKGYPYQGDIEDVLPSIGHMIEFLEFNFKKVEPAPTNDMYGVSLRYGKYWIRKELCDALWEATKEILGK